MGKKSDLLKIFGTMKATNTVYREQKEKIDNDERLSAVGRARKILDIETQTVSIIQDLQAKALKILEDARTEQAEAWNRATVGRLDDNGYQTGLANVIRMLQLQAIPPEDIKKTVELYRMDSNAMNAFRKIVEGYPPEVRSRYRIPGDNRRATELALNTIENDIHSFIDVLALQNPRFDMQLALTERYHFAPLSEDLTAEG